jgi:hypothetical protein
MKGVPHKRIKKGKIKRVRLQGVKKRERYFARNYTGRETRRIL